VAVLVTVQIVVAEIKMVVLVEELILIQEI